MRKALIFVFLLLCTGVQALFVPPTPPPMSKYPPYSEDAEEEIPYFLERHKNDMDAEDLYELGLLHILVHDDKKARHYLERAVKKDPRLVDAWCQLGYIDLWETKYLDAYHHFNKALSIEPCYKHATYGLLDVGMQWATDKKMRTENMQLFQKLYKCDPKDVDVVYFYARFLYEIGEYEKAERLAKKCLYLDDESKDAAYLLVNCYIKVVMHAFPVPLLNCCIR